MKKPLVILLAMLSAGAYARMAEPGSAELARALGDEGQHRLAALEYRRLALAEAEAANLSRWYWLAAHEYSLSGDWGLAGRMLDRAEDGGDEDISPAITWLRAERALAERDWREALFFYEDLRAEAAADGMEPWGEYAGRGAAIAALRGGDKLKAADMAPADSGMYVEAYAKGTDKSPRLGGLLGIIPGMGYLYSGEYGNAFRSVFLNGLFIWGMAETADDNSWGVFAVLTFFELTWYSGSIYGGIDSAHRFNERRLERAVEAVRGDAKPRVSKDNLPLFTIGFEY